MSRSFSIRSRILLLACGSAAVALVLACAGFAVNGVRTLQQAKLRQLSDQVKMVAFHAAPVLTLQNKEAGERSMASLRSDPTVEAICIVDLNQRIITSFGDYYAPPVIEATVGAGNRFLDFKHVAVVQPVVVGSRTLGHICALANTSDMEAQLMDFARIAVYVLATAMSVAIVLAARLQRGISSPIFALTHAAQRIAVADDYSIRVSGSAGGELLTLQSAFNRMLDHIQRSDEMLQRAHAELEERVAARTQELSLEIARRRQTQADLERAKEAAESANRAKSEFLANVSHEIRTPLNGIIGFTDLMLKGNSPISRDEQADFLGTIRRSGLHLADLINDVLDLSKIEAGRLETERIPFSPHDVIADVVAVLRLRAEEKRLQLTYDWSSPLPEKIESDPARLRQLLMNLIGNAIKFTETGGIRVVAGMTDQSRPLLKISVTDTGIGIASENLDSIFEPFTQADTSVTRRFGGTGLGLAISRKIASALGGELTVVSKLSHGSTFAVTVHPGPMHQVRLLTTPPVTRREPARTVDTPLVLPSSRILVADDGETNRKLVRLILQRAGAQVTMVENGQQVLDALDQQSFDVILLDMQMPVMDGYTAARALRFRGCTLPIVALTAHAMKGDEEKCKSAGCSEYLTKPIDAERLLATLVPLLAGVAAAAPQPATSSPLTLPAPVAGRDLPMGSPVPVGSTATGEGFLSSTLPTDDPEFREIVGEFVDRARQKVAAMHEARRRGEFDELRQLAHWLKGAGGTAGFPQFTTPARELENSARQERLTDVDVWLDSIQRIIVKIINPALRHEVPVA